MFLLIVRRLSNFCYDGRRTYEQKGSAMPATLEISRPQTVQCRPAPPKTPSQARVAAAVQAAYILEARTR